MSIVCPENNIKGYMGQQYTYYNIWKKTIVVTILINVAKAIFLLLCDKKDTTSN